MTVDDALIEKLARLSRLYFDEKDKEAIKGDLEKMIKFVEKLQEVNTAGIAPLTHMSASENVMRDDEPESTLTNEAALKNAKESADGFFRVPRVINK